MKKKVKRVVKKAKKHTQLAIRIWRAIAGLIIFLILVPTFVANHDHDKFYPIALSLTALACGLIIIIKQPFKKTMRNFLDMGMYLLLAGGLLLIVAAYVTHPVAHLIFLLVSGLLYAYGLQRLGLGIFVGVI